MYYRCNQFEVSQPEIECGELHCPNCSHILALCENLIFACESCVFTIRASSISNLPKYWFAYTSVPNIANQLKMVVDSVKSQDFDTAQRIGQIAASLEPTVRILDNGHTYVASRLRMILKHMEGSAVHHLIPQVSRMLESLEHM